MKYACRQESEHHFSSTLVECRLHAIGKTRDGVVVFAHRKTVNHQIHFCGRSFALRGKILFYGSYLSLNLNADKTLLEVFLQTLAHICRTILLAKMHGSKHHKACARGVRCRTPYHVLHALLLHLLSTDGTISASHSGKEHAHVFVYLGTRAHGGTRIAAAYLLLYGYGWWDALDVVAFGFAHAAKELAGITGKALHITALTFGIQGIKGKA